MNKEQLTKFNNLTLLQICSTVFPTGGFNHSFGLETYINNHKVKNKHDLLNILKTFLSTQFLYNDALGIKLLYEALEKNQTQFVYILDRLFHVSTLPKETREGYKKVGIRSIECLLDIIPECSLLKEYAEKVNKKEAIGNPTVAYTIAFHYLGVSLEEGSHAFLYMNVSNLIQNAVRAIPLGPSDGIFVGNEIKPFIFETIEKAKKYNIRDFGINGFSIEIAQMNHEDSLIRLFMS